MGGREGFSDEVTFRLTDESGSGDGKGKMGGQREEPKEDFTWRSASIINTQKIPKNKIVGSEGKQIALSRIL